MALASDLNRPFLDAAAAAGAAASADASPSETSDAPSAAAERPRSSARRSKSAILTRGSSDFRRRSATVFFTAAGRPSRSETVRSAWRCGVGLGSVTAASAEKSGGGGGGASAPLPLLDAGPAPPDALRFEGAGAGVFDESSFRSSRRGLDMISMGTDREPRMGASAGPATNTKRWFWWCDERSLIRTFSVAASPDASSKQGLDSSASSNNGTWRFRFLDWLKKPTWISPADESGSTSGSVAAS
mmetsp:Transcript_13370/g.41263  ORF Transcript_13370/g.41263 Transcript_13370/m.41263 type:complete len:244 (-) Transcript_13370:837-1568(-)